MFSLRNIELSRILVEIDNYSLSETVLVNFIFKQLICLFIGERLKIRSRRTHMAEEPFEELFGYIKSIVKEIVYR